MPHVTSFDDSRLLNMLLVDVIGTWLRTVEQLR